MLSSKAKCIQRVIRTLMRLAKRCMSAQGLGSSDGGECSSLRRSMPIKIISIKTGASIASALLLKSKMIKSKSKSSKRRRAPIRSLRCDVTRRLPFIVSAPRVGALRGWKSKRSSSRKTRFCNEVASSKELKQLCIPHIYFTLGSIAKCNSNCVKTVSRSPFSHLLKMRRNRGSNSKK